MTRHEETDFLRAIGRRLVNRRKVNGVTQDVLAEHLGLQQQAIQRYERTYYASAGICRLIDVSEALDVLSDEPPERLETGPVQMSEDWPGVFIRGDNAAGYMFALEEAQGLLPDGLVKAQIEGLERLLSSCIIGADGKSTEIVAIMRRI